MAQFYTLLTQVGQAKLANAMALGEQISISHLAVGDGGGSLPTPDSDRTALVNEQRRAPINLADIDPDNPNWIVVEQVLPPDVGGWTIREIGVFDSAGDLIAYGNYPETYKPTLDEGSGRTQTVRMVLQVSDTAAVTLRVDPSVVLATRKYVDDGDETVAQGAANALQQHTEADEAHTAHQISIAPIGQVPDAETVQEALAALGVLGTNFASLTEAQALESLTKLISPRRLGDAMNAHVLGMGQSWQNVLGSRAWNTSYTNTTGRAIMVSVCARGTSSGGSAFIALDIDEEPVFTSRSKPSGGAAYASVSGIVPAESTYIIRRGNQNEDSSAYLISWAELR